MASVVLPVPSWPASTPRGERVISEEAIAIVRGQADALSGSETPPY